MDRINPPTSTSCPSYYALQNQQGLSSERRATSALAEITEIPPSYSESERQAQSESQAHRVRSISDIPKDQMKALVSNITNAVNRVPVESFLSPILKKNFSDLQSRFQSKDNQVQFTLGDQRVDLFIKAPGLDESLPVFKTSIKETINIEDPAYISKNLPKTLQEKLGVTTILELLKQKFPNLTSSSKLNETMPKFVIASAIPLSEENKGYFFPQLEIDCQIAYLAWDSSGLYLAEGFKDGKCDILINKSEKQETFCGAMLSQGNLEGIEKGAGVSDYFMTSKVTVMGILISKPSRQDRVSQLWSDGGRAACDGLIARGPSSRGSIPSSDHTTFGMLGAEGVEVLPVNQEHLKDRYLERGEKLIPFCLEIIPQFSSKENPVKKDDLEMAIDMQFQDKLFSRLHMV